MRGIFFIVLLIPLVGSINVSPLMNYFIDLQGCYIRAILGTLKTCASNPDTDCYIDQTLMQMKVCFKPALFKLYDSLDDPDNPVLTSKTTRDFLVCWIDLCFDEIKPCIDGDVFESLSTNGATESDGDDYLFIDALGCIFKTFSSSLRKCRATHDHHMKDDL